MEPVLLIIALALLQYVYFSFQVGMARAKYKVAAPAVSGHPAFERTYRVQQNTLEQLVLFLPAVSMFAWLTDARGWPGAGIAAGIGVVWLIGRLIYARSYIKDPASRGLGFMLTLVPSMLMILISIVLILLAVV